MDNNKHNAEMNLELIAQIIEQSKRNLNNHSFNSWIGWGVFTAVLGLIIWGIIKATGCHQWHWLWFLEFAYAIYDGKRNEKRHIAAKSHIDSAIIGIWKTLGWLYIFTPIVMTFMAIYLQHFYALNLIMPLVLIYTSIGVAFTGIILREKWITAIPVICTLSPLYMLGVISSQQFSDRHIILFISTIFCILVIPGIILNIKCKNK